MTFESDAEWQICLTVLKSNISCFTILFIEVILISSFSMAALQFSFAAYDDQLYKQVAEVLNLSTENVEIKLKEIDKLSFTIFSDKGRAGLPEDNK